MKRPLLGTVVLGLGGIFVGARAHAADTPEAAPAAAEPAAAGATLKSTGTAKATSSPDAEPAQKTHGVGAGLGLAPGTPDLQGGENLSAKEGEALTPTTTAASADEWKFDYHGYFRAPMRVSFGPPTPGGTGTPLAGASMYPPEGDMGGFKPNQAPSGTQLHGSPPRVPGANYIDWEYTNTVPGPWAQLNFSYGNSRAMGTVIVAAYSQTDAGYRDLQAQLGINQAFLTLNYPEAFGDRGGLVWNVGSFSNRYGTAGKYDGGMYETYLFGRTHVAGETLTGNIDVGGNWGLSLEQGVGAKIEVIPFTNNQLYQIFKSTPPGAGNNPPQSVVNRDQEYLPYAGPVPQGSTFIHHEHVALAYKKLLTFAAHFIYSYTPDDNWDYLNDNMSAAASGNAAHVTDQVPRFNGPTPGSMTIWGGEVRLNGGVLGDGYLGYSHIDAKNINALADAIEVLHSYGGWQFKQNFFGVTFDPHTGGYQGPQNESGTVDSVAFQYTFSFGALAHYPAAFWGDGPDLNVTLFGMLSIIKSLPANVPNDTQMIDMSDKKLKFGGDVAYTPLPWFGMGLRFDMVEPDLDAKDSRYQGSKGNFEVISPRLVFKTAFVTHEAITVQYQRYFLGDNAFPIYPFQWVPKADANLVAVSATMWW